MSDTCSAPGGNAITGTSQAQTGCVLRVTIDDRIAHLVFHRPAKRNAINDATLQVLNLSEQSERETQEVLRHSRGWNAIMDKIQLSGVPVVSVLTDAVMGGGLEIAAATHVRVAEPSVKFQLPEGKRGIFVGGGATVRVGRIIGSDRMTEMMLTGRVYGANEAERLGLAHYVVGEGEGMAKAVELARGIADNSSLVNYLVIQSIARIGDMSSADGLYTESLSAALSQTGPDAREGLIAFLEKRKPNFS